MCTANNQEGVSVMAFMLEVNRGVTRGSHGDRVLRMLSRSHLQAECGVVADSAILWTRGDGVVYGSDRVRVEETGVIDIFPLHIKDSGLYKCVGEDQSKGWIEASLNLEVVPRKGITSCDT